MDFYDHYRQLTPSEAAYVDGVLATIKLLCSRLKLEEPTIGIEWHTSLNITMPTEIRIAIPDSGVGDLLSDVEGRHIFAHWLCNLETTDDGDKVADIIADLLKQVAT